MRINITESTMESRNTHLIHQEGALYNDFQRNRNLIANNDNTLEPISLADINELPVLNMDIKDLVIGAKAYSNNVLSAFTGSKPHIPYNFEIDVFEYAGTEHSTMFVSMGDDISIKMNSKSPSVAQTLKYSYFNWNENKEMVERINTLISYLNTVIVVCNS